MFSVIIPLKDFHPYLSKCFFSVKNQTFPPREIIIIFNNASDELITYTKLFCEKEFNLNYIFLKSYKKGPGAARDLGSKKANEDFLAFLDSDDEWPINYLEIRRKHIQRKNAKFSASRLLMKNEKTNKSFIRYQNKSIFKHNDFLRGNPIATSSVIVSRNLLNQIGGFSHLEKRNDFATWLRVSRKEYCHYLNDIEPVTYIIRSNSLSSNKFLLLKYNILAIRELKINYISCFIIAVRSAIYSILHKLICKFKKLTN